MVQRLQRSSRSEKRSRRSTPCFVRISGIDASGKGFVTTRIAESLQKRGIKLAVISADGWLNLPHVRFHQQDEA
jgi:uridine kinase